MTAAQPEMLADVEASVPILDDLYGEDWPFLIDLDDLQIESCSRCISGQLHFKGRGPWYGELSRHIEDLTLNGALDTSFATAIGPFCQSEAEPAWHEVITRLRKERA